MTRVQKNTLLISILARMLTMAIEIAGGLQGITGGIASLLLLSVAARTWNQKRVPNLVLTVAWS